MEGLVEAVVAMKGVVKVAEEEVQDEATVEVVGVAEQAGRVARAQPRLEVVVRQMPLAAVVVPTEQLTEQMAPAVLPEEHAGVEEEPGTAMGAETQGT